MDAPNKAGDVVTPNINFARGVPAESSFPRSEIEQCVNSIVEAGDSAAFQYGPALGPVRLRTLIAEKYGLQINQVIVGNGSIGLFDLLCRCSLEPNDKVIVEAPCYDRVLQLLRFYNVDVRPVRLEYDGPVIEDVVRACDGKRPAFFYMVPDFQNPSGATYSLEKRLAIVDVARKFGVRLLEDAPYRELRYCGDALPAFLDLAGDLTIQLNSFSKLLSPALRAAYLVADPKTVAIVARAAEDTYVTPGNFALSIAAEWLARGYLGPQVEKLKNLYGPRLAAMKAALQEFLPDERFYKPDGGFFIGVTLHDSLDESAVHSTAKAAGVDLANGVGFFLKTQPTPFLRLPFCSMDEETAKQGIEIIANVLSRLRSNRAA